MPMTMMHYPLSLAQLEALITFLQTHWPTLERPYWSSQRSHLLCKEGTSTTQSYLRAGYNPGPDGAPGVWAVSLFLIDEDQALEPKLIELFGDTWSTHHYNEALDDRPNVMSDAHGNELKPQRTQPYPPPRFNLREFLRKHFGI